MPLRVVRGRARLNPTAVQAGQITAAEVATWWTAQEEAAEAQTFFAANLVFIVAGRKPQPVGP